MLGHAASSPIIIQARASAQSALYQANLYKETQNVEMALFFYDQAKVAFKHIAKAQQLTPSLSQVRKAITQAQTPQTAEDGALRQRIAQVYFERAQLLKQLDDIDKAKKSGEKAQAWGHPEAAAWLNSLPQTLSSSSTKHDVISPAPSSAYFSSGVSPSPLPQAPEAKLQEKHQWVAQVFETILKQFQDLDLCQTSPSLFLIYAHNNHRLGQADADVSQRVIQWLSNLRSNLYSDRSASGHQTLPFSATLEEKTKANDILSSQLCLLPNHPDTVDHVVLCGSELLGHYMASPYYQRFCEAIQHAYQQAASKNDFAQIEDAIRQVVDANLNEKEFHHVLTELAFLQIREAHLKGEHGIIPMLLNSKAQQCLPTFILDSTTIRIEDSIWREPNFWNGRQTYRDEGLHVGFFKLLKRLLVKQERCIALVEEKIYQGCLKKFREDQSHTLAAEEFSRFLNQACVSALDALKQEYGADLRELNVQKAYESLLTEIQQLNGQSLISSDQLGPALEASYSAKRLAIQRLSGPLMSMEHCYINLAIVEYEKVSKEEEKSKEGENKEGEEGGEETVNEKKAEPDHFRRLPSAEAMHSNQQKLVPLEKLFDPRELSKDKTITPKRILIRGRAGIGKTTLSKKIVYEYTQKGQWKDRFDYVLWISLRTLKGKQHGDLATLFYETYFPSHPKGLALAKTLAAQIEGPAKERTLFVLDGWDEVAQEWGEQEPMHKFLHQILNQPAVLITSRPYVDLKQANPMDLELETVGFSPENVSAYLDNPALIPATQAKEMKDFIRTNPFVQGLVNVPIQLDALCFSWDEIKRLQQQTKGTVTITALYQAMMNKLWRKDILRLGKLEGGKLLNAETVNSLRSARRIEKWVKAEQDFLGALAFRGLQDNRIEFDTVYLDNLIDQLEKEGVDLPITLEANLKKLSFLHTDEAEDGQYSYHFMHLTFQEFFAAKHFVQCWKTEQEITLLSADAKQWTKAPPDAFVRQHKYNPRYEIFWWFVSGLLRAESLDRFFTVLEAEPRDLFGAAHQRLIMNNLYEASRDKEAGLSREMRDRLEQSLRQWLQLEIDNTGQGTLANSLTFPEFLLRECLEGTTSNKAKSAIAHACGQRSALSDSTVQALIALTKNKDREVSRIAAEALGQQSSPEAIQTLIALTKNKDREVSRIAAEALGQQSSPEAIQTLIALTKNEGIGVRGAAAEALGKQFSPEALQHLIALTKNEDRELRCAAVETLGQQSLPEAIQTLIALTKNEDREVRRAAAEALGQQSSLPSEAIQPLIALTKDEDWQVRRVAAEMLGQQSLLPPEAIQFLIALTKDKDEYVRRAAVKALGQQSSLPPEAIQTLTALTKNGDWQVSCAAVKALGQQSSPEAIQILIALTKDEDSDVRRAVAETLGQQSLLPPETIQTLIVLMKDWNWLVIRAAAEALGQQSLLPPETIQTLIALTKDKDREVRCAVVKVLGQQSSLSPPAIQTLIALTKDKDEYGRRSAAYALGQQSLLPPEAIQTLIVLTKDKDRGVKRSAVYALGQQSLLPPDAIQTLIALTKDKDREVRRSVAYALGQQSSLPPDAIQTLIALTKDEDREVRRAAVAAEAEALGQQSSLPPEAIQTLIALTKDEDREVRRRVAYALGQQSLLPPEAIQILIALTKDEDREVRRAVVKALGQQFSLPPETIQALIALTKDEDREVRRSVAYALGQQSSLPPEAIQTLIALTKGEGGEVRHISANALGKHRWTLYRLLLTLSQQEMQLIYQQYLLQQRFDQSVPFYIQDGALCFYTAEGLQTVPFNHADNEEAFKQAVQQTQQSVGIPLSTAQKVGLFRNPLAFMTNKLVSFRSSLGKDK